MLKIGVDIMSGDNSPAMLLSGCVRAVQKHKVIVAVIGDPGFIKNALKKYDYPQERLEIVASSEIITMDDSPTRAFKEKKDSSLVVGCNILAQQKISAFITPGNTGAALAAALFLVRRIPGVKRPCISVPIPTVKGHTLLVDAGANMDSLIRHLRQFAVMGVAYMQKSRDIAVPSVGILNIGSEKGKGNETTQKLYKELSKPAINFVGFVEPSDLYEHKADVIVADGFVGNITLKTLEATARRMVTILKTGITKRLIYKFAALLLKPVFADFKRELSTEDNGAAPLLGIKYPFYIAHGSSTAAEIESAIRIALYNAEHKTNEAIFNNIKEWG
jgi:phosphate acyltransferase